MNILITYRHMNHTHRVVRARRLCKMIQGSLFLFARTGRALMTVKVEDIISIRSAPDALAEAKEELNKYAMQEWPERIFPN